MTDDRAREALDTAAQSAGVTTEDACLVRFGSNAVFRLSSAGAIARVSRSLASAVDAERELGVARWLKQSGIRAVEALEVPQPVDVDGHVVTFWVEASTREEYGSASDLAGLLVRLHRLEPPAGLGLPALRPFDRVAPRLDRATTLGEDDRQFLAERASHLAAQYEQLAFELPSGVIHGDASVGNVILDQGGNAVLSDLDGFAMGHREWDLVLTALYYERFGWHTEAEYQSFVGVYGHDVMAWSGYRVLADVREFLMVTWLAQTTSADPDVHDELSKRIGALRSGGSRVRDTFAAYSLPEAIRTTGGNENDLPLGRS